MTPTDVFSVSAPHAGGSRPVMGAVLRQRLDNLTRERLLRGGPMRFTPEQVAHRWRGVPVAYGRRVDGRVTATVLGVTGVGPAEGNALLDLERRLRAG